MKNLPNMKVYKKSEIPRDLNYSKSDRIGNLDILMVNLRTNNIKIEI